MSKKGTDQRVIESEFDVAAERKANEILSNAGIQDADDLGPGRFDVGLVAQHLARPEPELDAEAIEESVRDKQFSDMMESPEQPYQPVQQTQPTLQQPQATQQATEPDSLAKMQADLEAAKAESQRMKEQYARESEKWGQERKRIAEQRARGEYGGNGGGFALPPNAYTPQQPGYYDPRIIGDADPNAPLSAGQTAALLQNMAAAFGAQLNAREHNVIEAARELRNYDLTSNEEADLIERHGWLATLDRASQIKAMRDLVLPLRTASQPAANPPTLTPKPVDMTNLARARHLTATTFIEPSSRTSTQEQAAATGTDSSLAKKIAEYREAMAARPGMPNFEAGQYGENKKAERLLREINALQRRRA